MQIHRGIRLSGPSCRRWHALLLGSIAAAWWPVTTHAGDADWLWQNPLPVASSCEGWGLGEGDIAFLDAQTGMAATCGSTILRTDDGGNTWVDAAGNVEGSDRVFTGISIVDSNTAVISGINTAGKLLVASVMRTDDGGATWVEQTADLNLPLFTALQDVSFSDSDSGVAVGQYGDWTSPDFGEPVIIRTSDGGNSWSRASEVTGTSRAFLYGVKCADPATCVAVGGGTDENGEVGALALQTVDGGDTWVTKLFDESAPTPFEGAGLYDVICPVGDTCIAVGSGGMIYKSTDGGSSWSPRNSGTTVGLDAISCADAQSCLAVGDGTNEASARVILRTEDQGETWTTVLLAESSGPLRGVAFHGVTASATAIGQIREPFLHTTDGGASWETHPQFLNTLGDKVLRSVAFSNSTTGVAVGVHGSGGHEEPTDRNAGLLLWTGDAGNTWMDLSLSLPVQPVPALADVDLPDATTGIVVGGVQGSAGNCDEAVILRSTDAGFSWSDLTENLPQEYQNYRLAAVDFTNSSMGTVVGGAAPAAACGSPGGVAVILRTTDGGSTWIDSTPPDASGFFTDVFFSDLSLGTVVGLGGRILRTTDGGATWSEQTSDTSAALHAVAFSDVNHGWVVGTNTVLRTTDGGAVWVDARPDALPAQFDITDVKFVDAENGIMVGELTRPIIEGEPTRYGVVLTTTDGGDTWLLEEGRTTRVEKHFSAASTDSDNWVVVGWAAGQDDTTLGPVWSSSVLQKRAVPTFLPLSLGPSSSVMCEPEGTQEELPINVSVGAVGGYAGVVQLSTTGEPTGVTSDLELSSIEAPGSTTWTLTVDSSVSPGQHVLTLTGDDGTEQHLVNFVLDVVDSQQVPTPAEPANEAAEVDVQPTFIWDGIAAVGQYRIQVATDSEFGGVVIDEEVDGTSLASPIELESDTQYFWRVQGVSECFGSDTWSEVFSFTTEAVPLVQISSQMLEFELPLGGSDSASLDIANVGTGELIWTIEPIQQAPVTCNSDRGIISHDDGSVDTAYNAGLTQKFVDRFAPSAYPAEFRFVCVAFLTPDAPSYEFEIVVFDDDGPDGAPGTELGALSVSAEGIPTGPSVGTPAWFSYDISPLNIIVESGSVYIGVRWTQGSNPGSLYVAADNSPVNPPGFAGGYVAGLTTDGDWEPIVSRFGTYRSLFVRAVTGEGCPDAPWLSASPESGSTEGGGSTPVIVMVDTAGLGGCEYRAALRITTNDASTPLVFVPVTLTIPGSELAFDPESVDFGDVEAGVTSPPEVVTLHSFGALDATSLEFQVLGDDFDVDTSACDSTLPIGDQCEVVITFTPPGVGPSNAVLEVHSDDGAVASVSLSGQGLPETEAFVPMGLEVDFEPIISDANGVFEPGELGPVAPMWYNGGLFTHVLEGEASNLAGPEGPDYTLLAADADYGEVDTGEMASCRESSLCYEMDIGPAGVARPAPHWDATFDEALSDETTHTWTLHLGNSFVDVPRNSLFYRPVETLLHSGVTGGCSDIEYCPTGSNTRSQMAVFLLRAVEGGDYTPPACEAGEEEFFDVSADSVFCPWIEELAARGVTSGCGGGNYCPNTSVTRAQMAIFLLKALEGEDYTPPACSEAFTDVPCPSLFADWIEELADRGITSGCSATEYCPSTPVTRAQMASFVTKTFGLALYGP